MRSIMLTIRRYKKHVGLLVLILFVLACFYVSTFDITKPRYDYQVIKYEQTRNLTNNNKTITKLFSIFSCCANSIKLLIMVKSNIVNFERRKVIRDTWGKTLDRHANDDFRTFFVVAKSNDIRVMDKIYKESEMYKDVVFVDIEEIFHHLPYKIQASVEWASKHCKYEYYLQTDDDVFINVPKVFSVISTQRFPKNRVYYGYVSGYAHPLREGKYKVLESEYNGRFYPPFIATGFIIFSHDVIQDMVKCFTKPPFKLDDVYIGFLIYNMDVKPTHSDDVNFYGLDCKYNNRFMAYHGNSFTKKSECIVDLFVSMIKYRLNNSFIRTHYKIFG